MSLTRHHTPNFLPRGHTREDYDFDYKDGVSGPIRVEDTFWGNDNDGPQGFTVWCRSHGWEREIIPEHWITAHDNGDYKPDEYAWRCPTCGVSRRSLSYRGVPDAVKACLAHIAAKHDGLIPHRRHKWVSDEGDDPREFIQ